MTDDERRIELEGIRAAIAVKLAMLSRRDHDVDVITSGLPEAVLRACIHELADSYWDAVRFSGVGVIRLHNAVQRDAMTQAAINTEPATGA